METKTRNKKLLYAILIYAVLFLGLLMVSDLAPFHKFIGTLLHILRPVLIGLALAYLLNPFFRLFENKLFHKVRPLSFRRVLSLIFTYLTLFAIVAILLVLLIPQLTDSILNFVENSESYLSETLDSVNALIEKLNASLPQNAEGGGLIPPLKFESISEGMNKLLGTLKIDGNIFMKLISAENLSTAFKLFENITSLLGDLLFGFFISLYLLASKEKRYAQIMRWRRAFLSERTNLYITKVCTTADRSFGGFLKGKILDSSIVGVLVFLSISLLQVPYAILIAVVIAITDIVPIIGPFIGVIPSAVIILLTDPAKVIPFILCILVIQQIDGNILAPKILGENTGVSSLCVMISITTLGSLWGLMGMILGVPLFATVLELTGEFLDNRLRKKGLSTATEDYYTAGLAEDSEETAPPAPDEQPPKAELVCAGNGILTYEERRMLELHALAVKHGILGSPDKQALEAFAQEVHTQQPQSEEAAPAPDTTGEET